MSLTIGRHLESEESRQLIRAVSAYILRITDVKQGREGTPTLTMDDGKGVKFDQEYTVEVGEYALPRLGSLSLLLLLLFVVLLSVLQSLLSKDGNPEFERHLWNGMKTASPCNE